MTIFFLFSPIYQSTRVLEQSLALFTNDKNKFKIVSPHYLLLSYLEIKCDTVKVKY